VLLFNLLYCEFRPSADLTLQVGASFATTNMHQVLSDCVRYSLGADERRKTAANDWGAATLERRPTDVESAN
jgi:hypothetical protein